ncbi:uncharacterized protein EI97DRAFT_380328 [Westerdykella ornata]|uniref:EGF-like domain-containing protein n=1 Tax=Westerdykella ornata TaxID=318751 RepID=A0A6A6JFI0_WESOR|nr:uncharacterized protein EI97DRAFT_380328 [Westerdykella ornata]KAF2275035.1 hypothetical protein EI97DRAFT_380328 [Westerdykella ornata]
MSYDSRQASGPYGTSNEMGGETKKGSVRAARGKLQATNPQGQVPDRPRIAGLPQRPDQLVSQPSPPRPQATERRELVPEDDRSAGSPSPQWPLPTKKTPTTSVAPEARNMPRPPNRGPPPRRPPRPVSDDFAEETDPPDVYRSSYQSENFLSPTSAAPSSRPLTTSSVASEASSLGSIPDFPVPIPPMPAVQPLPRRLPTLGPPPSARRGPPSYYTQSSFVSPIAEESETRSNTIRSHRGSFASSAVIPINDDQYYREDDDDGVRSEDDETVTSEFGRNSRASDHDEKSELVQPTLVRQASLGRRTKPSLMTIKSVESFGEKRNPSVKKNPGVDEDNLSKIGNTVLAARDGLAGRAAQGSQGPSLGNSSILLDPSSSSEESLDGFVTSMHPMQPGDKQTSFGDRVGKRRPPRIDVDAVRDAEARGSLTSLPELIKRATRLAANLDRGKTASRLGLEFWEAGAPEKRTRQSGTLSDMLAAFPPPGEATPTGNRTPNNQRWPGDKDGGYGRTSSVSSGEKPTRRRRCCGLPMWTFVTLLIVLLFLVAAAVIIPIVLIVVPNMKEAQAQSQTPNAGNRASNLPNLPAPTSSAPKNQCDGIITCRNGGVAILNADRSCNCVCINGFTGRACENEGDAACTTTNVSGAANNATLGSGIPRLFESAQKNFSIPLDPPTLLSIFSDLGLSCNTENALITFNGLAARSVLNVETTLEPSKSLPLLNAPHGAQDIGQLGRRQAVGEPGQVRPNTVQTGAPAPSPSPSTSSVPIRSISRNTTAIDFARIGVLLLLQETRELEQAANAQVKIQEFLSDASTGDARSTTVDLGQFRMDLLELSVDFRNGTTIQGRPAIPKA